MPTDMSAKKKGASRHTADIPAGKRYSAQLHADREEDDFLRLKINEMQRQSRFADKIGDAPRQRPHEPT